MNDSAIMVFTSRNVDRMVAEGGSQRWVLDPERARMCDYIVCAWNESGQFARHGERMRHGEAFLVGKITTVELSPEGEGRYIVRFSEIARVSVPNAWKGMRNPITYCRLSDLGIDPGKLHFVRAAR